MSTSLNEDPRKSIRNSSAKYQIICCQRCHQMLDIDTTFPALQDAIDSEFPANFLTNLDSSRSRDELHGTQDSTSSSSDIARKIREAAMKSPDDGEDLPLGKKKIIFSENESKEKDSRLLLFELLSSVSLVDHPLCSSCTDSVMEELELEIQAAEKECATYEYYLKQFKRNLADGMEKGNDEEVARLEAELKELQDEEMILRLEMKEANDEKAILFEKLDGLRREGEKIKIAEDEYYTEKLVQERSRSELKDEQESVNYQMRVAEMLLDKLKKTNVFNIAFHIWHQGQFGTINGFRLGRLPGVPVEWSEINAAWGQTVLLLYSLAKKMNFTFQRYRLVPFGSHSYIECIDDQNKKLPLHGDGGFKFVWDSKFDNAMAAFLDCLHQFKCQVERSGSQFCLPYDIDPVHARIRDVHSGATYCIRSQLNSVEQWTKALKWMLTNLKWGLAWVVAQFGDSVE